MKNSCIIGIDVGSSAVKVGLLDYNGSLIDYISLSYETNRKSETFVEQNPKTWFGIILNSLSEFENKHLDLNITALGLCSQVNTHVFVDRNGNNLMPAIFWQDGRAIEEARELDQNVTTEQKLAWWGAPMPIDASHVISRMLWVQRNKPEIWDKTRYVLLPKDYCIMKLTGECISDPLSNIGLTNNKLEYIPDVLNLVPGAADRVAPLLEIKEIVGPIRKGVPYEGIKVVNGTMDAWTGLLGTGGYKEKSSIYLSGTSEILGINSGEVNPTPGVIVFPEYNKIKLHAGPTQSGGASKLWFCSLFNIKPKEMINLVQESNFKEMAPIFLPHLQGERAPIWQSNLKGMFYGMNSNTDSSMLARAVYEGVAFSARWLLETLEASSKQINDELSCGGGGFQSDIWNQIRANVLNKKIKRLAIKDPGILGAAGIAWYGIGVFDNLDEAFKNIIRFDKFYEPNKDLISRYSDVYQIYKEITDFNIKISQKHYEINK